MTPRHAVIFSVFLDSTLAQGVSYWWRPRGFSMEPVIRDGDRVLVGPVQPDRLPVGAVVKYRVGDELRMHRLVGRITQGGEARFVLRGDNGGVEDTVDTGALVGLALAVERDGRTQRLDSKLARWRAVLRGLTWGP